MSDAEFEQVKNQLQFSSFYKAGEWLVGENGKVMVHVQRDTERLHLVVMNHEHIAGGSSVYEVINQYSALKSDDEESIAERDRRFDVTLMINGLPMIHIELKNRQHSYMDAFWQIKKYISEGKFTGIFSAVQMFVISNGVDTKYFAAASDTELNPKFMSGWVDTENNPVSDYIDFARSVLRIPQAHEMIARYTVLDEDAKRLILLRLFSHSVEPERISAIHLKFGRHAQREHPSRRELFGDLLAGHHIASVLEFRELGELHLLVEQVLGVELQLPMLAERFADHHVERVARHLVHIRNIVVDAAAHAHIACLLYTSPSPRD